jgi:type I restriction enzyme M protein
MLDVTTKRKIDSARQILVGKVPDPKAQVEQITTALVYKFMDDMDKESQELGGDAKFFTNGFEKYSWTKLLDKRLSGQERLDLYVQAITNMSKNPHIPQLFRDIFKGAFLPYNDSETLSLFLKEIDGFTYDHSENLGVAFEYLLSALGSQGEAGQFRTPRHIIDFIVRVVDPKKNETILDPACGTAGFLISAYKHIRKHNSSNFTPQNESNYEIKLGDTVAETALQERESYRGDLLSPSEREKVMQNIVGYDISPDMVKLSLVNLYLHGFSNPKIQEYDTLTSEKHWGEQFDVIMANPPFMTPKGGIRPHKRFTFKSRRAEALFVDYIIEHLRPNGKAAIIVPDGIVNNKSFSKLRRTIVDNGLYAVVSLHQYVFKPYAGAKTCILFFDKNLKKNQGNVLFADMENDGFQKGVQRFKIEEDDIPNITRAIKDFRSSDKSLQQDFKKYGIKATAVNLNTLDKSVYFHYVDQISLFPNTYIYQNSVAKSPSKAVKISDVFSIRKGTLQSTKASPGQYRFVTASDEYLTHEEYKHDTEALVVAVAAGGSLGKPQYVKEKFIASDLCFVLTPKKKKDTDLLFYLYYFKDVRPLLVKILAKGVSKPSINKTDFSNLLIDSFDSRQQKNIGLEIREVRASIKQYEENIQALEKKLIEDIDKVRNGK